MRVLVLAAVVALGACQTTGYTSGRDETVPCDEVPIATSDSIRPRQNDVCRVETTTGRIQATGYNAFLQSDKGSRFWDANISYIVAGRGTYLRVPKGEDILMEWPDVRRHADRILPVDGAMINGQSYDLFEIPMSSRKSVCLGFVGNEGYRDAGYEKQKAGVICKRGVEFDRSFLLDRLRALRFG